MRGNPYGKAFGIAAVFLFLLDPERLRDLPAPQMALDALIWLTFSGISLLPQRCWSKPRAIAAAVLFATECAAGAIWFHEIKLLYFGLIMLFAAALRPLLPQTYIPIITAMIVTSILYIRFGRSDVFSFLSFALLGLTLYLFLRSQLQRKRIREINERHLAELQYAYEQLQDASKTVMQFAVLEERTRIAREIHDAVGHSLTSLVVQMQALRYMIKEHPLQAEQALEEMLAVARQGLRDIRVSVHALAGDRSLPRMSALKSLLLRMEASASIGFFVPRRSGGRRTARRGV